MPAKHLLVTSACVFLALASAAHAQTSSAPLLEPKPTFTPGMYETEARNSAFEGGNTLFEDVGCWIHDSGVNISEFLKSK